jgi:hypothetical protein
MKNVASRTRTSLTAENLHLCKLITATEIRPDIWSLLRQKQGQICPWWQILLTQIVKHSEKVNNFIYLGDILSENNQMQFEIAERIRKGNKPITQKQNF